MSPVRDALGRLGVLVELPLHPLAVVFVQVVRNLRADIGVFLHFVHFKMGRLFVHYFRVHIRDAGLQMTICAMAGHEVLRGSFEIRAVLGGTVDKLSPL